MRLTLRTMLAYMDGILEPDDAEDIRKKIEDSEYANNLLHRTRDVMRRLRLTAPELASRIAGLDPNTVAEYLDNTLHAEGVTDFEKVCLDSDIHLAEVAACHQILTLVLGEPAEIDPESRERMYKLPEVAAASAVAEALPAGDVPASGDGEAKADEDGQAGRKKPVVPDYLREPEKKRRRLLPAIAMVGLAIGFLAVVLLAFGQFEPGSPLRDFLAANLGIGVEKPVDEADDDSDTPVKPGDEDDGEKPVDETPVDEGPVDETPIDEGPVEPPVGPAEPPVGPVEPPVGPVEPPVGPVEPPVGPVEPPVGPVEPPVGPVEPPVGPVEPPVGPVEPPVEPPAPLPQQMGRFMSDNEILLNYDVTQKDWFRIPARGGLNAGDQLVTPPTYRVEVALSAGLTLQVLGGSNVELLPADETGVIGLKLNYGRVVLMPLAQPGLKLRLVFGDRQGIVTFKQAETVVAAEVTRVRPAGADPEQNPSTPVSQLFVTSGSAEWQEGGEPLALSAPSRLKLGDAPGGAPDVGHEYPKWVIAETISPLDARASASMATALRTGRSASLGLLELAEHRQREVRWLAMRSLAHVAQFDTMISMLGDEEQRTEWPDYVDQLRAAVNLGPEIAAGLRESLQKQYGDEGSAMYRMLWGYSQEDLKNGEDAKLVGYLESESLPMRVLAFWNLNEITGQRFSFRANDLPAKRDGAVRRWKDELAAGKIRWPE